MFLSFSISSPTLPPKKNNKKTIPEMNIDII